MPNKWQVPGSVLSFGLLAIALGVFGCPEASVQSNELAQLVIQYRDASAEFYPTQASSLGLHEYDGYLGPRNPEQIDAWVKQVKRFQTQAEVLKGGLKNLEDEFDRNILEWTLERELFDIRTLQIFRRNPLTYAFNLDLSGLLLRTMPDWPQRASAIVSRLEHFPSFLKGGRKSIGVPPRPVTETAIRSFRNLIPFLRNDLPIEMKGLDPEVQARLERALPKAIHAVEDMTTWLEEEVLPKTTNNFALGEDTYLAMLRTQEQFNYSIDQLLEMGRKELIRLQDQFKQTAKKIDADKTPQEIARLISLDHPSRDELVSFTQSELGQLRQQVIEKDLITIPEGPGTKVQASPAFRRWNTAYIMTPGPLDHPTVQAIYFISPGEVDLTPQQIKSWMRSVNNYAVRNISVHEVYPGHYVNMLYVRNTDTLMRKLDRSYAFTEGWAHYTEEMFVDHVYEGTEPHYQLGQIQDALLRICRYMTSIGLHTQNWSIDQGTKFFVENAYIEEILAQQQAIRGTFDPGYLVYSLGKLYIKQLRKDYQKKVGENFKLKNFHNTLLKYGNPPLPMVRMRMLEE